MTTTKLNWFEVINEDGDWLKFDNISDAIDAFNQLKEEGENVTLMKPDEDWSEEDKSYEILESNFE